jgi:arylsulfatase
MENAFLNLKSRAHTVTAEVEVGARPARGVLIAQAGRFGGWSLYVKDGRPRYTYNFGGGQLTTAAAKRPLTAGKHVVRVEFVPESPQPGAGAEVRLFVDGALADQVRVPKTMPFIYSGDEGADVGVDNETNVTDDYAERDNHFDGKLAQVVVELAPQLEKAAATAPAR